MSRQDMIFRDAPELREIARGLKDITAICWRLNHFDVDRIGFYYEVTCEENPASADIRAVKEPWRSVLADRGTFWDYLVCVYGYHAEGKSENWLRILLYHELRHIGFDGKLVEHNIEDFADILRDFGINWGGDPEALPDIKELKPIH
jgi:hypothetical protein